MLEMTLNNSNKLWKKDRFTDMMSNETDFAF